MSDFMIEKFKLLFPATPLDNQIVTLTFRFE